MVSKSNLVFSKAAASRILGVPKTLIAGFKRFFRVCWVWVCGSRPRFISKKLFLQHFAEHRQQQGRELPVQQWPNMPNWYEVGGQNNNYPVVIESTGPECACEDYKNQIAILGKGVCKHGYAVLLSLGYCTLRDYLAR